MTKWCLTPMFATYCVAFAAAALLLGPKALILPAVEFGLIGGLAGAFCLVEWNHGRKRTSTSK